MLVFPPTLLEEVFERLTFGSYSYLAKDEFDWLTFSNSHLATGCFLLFSSEPLLGPAIVPSPTYLQNVYILDDLAIELPGTFL